MSKMKKYNLNEIFYSIQGEAFHAGTPVIFIRFAGCNLNCHFCDTDFSLRLNLTKEQILARLYAYPCKTIVLTGGEPTIQVDNEFVELFLKHGYTVHIETNGTHPVASLIDWVTVSPKPTGELAVKSGDELKVVYEGQDLKQYEELDFKHFYLQPMSMTNTKQVIREVLLNPKWKISTQLQKIWRIE